MSDIGLTFNSNDMYRISKMNNISKSKTYSKILSRISEAIPKHAAAGNMSCVLTIPTFIVGLPVYNVHEAGVWCVDALKKHGFDSRLGKEEYGERKVFIYVSWEKNST
jgi:hypothetical protein